MQLIRRERLRPPPRRPPTRGRRSPEARPDLRLSSQPMWGKPAPCSSFFFLPGSQAASLHSMLSPDKHLNSQLARFQLTSRSRLSNAVLFRTPERKRLSPRFVFASFSSRPNQPRHVAYWRPTRKLSPRKRWGCRLPCSLVAVCLARVSLCNDLRS